MSHELFLISLTRNRFVQLLCPFQADRRFFEFHITAGVGLKLNRVVIIYLIDRSMYTCNCDYFVALLQVLDELLLIFCLLGLRRIMNSQKTRMIAPIMTSVKLEFGCEPSGEAIRRTGIICVIVDCL